VSVSFIALGSNLSDPEQQLRAAVRAVARLPDSRVTAVSNTYRSAAVGPGEQPDYLNAVLRIETRLEPRQLLTALQTIEADRGRVRGDRWGPRTLDLDILLYDDLELESALLTLPHPAMKTRNFVLYPLRDIVGSNLLLPDGTDLDTLLANCSRGELADAGVDLSSEATCQPGPGT
jgi:2-amino-4-hydroxy-6-hydroxymethyldihydropteridine diphosphokinase